MPKGIACRHCGSLFDCNSSRQFCTKDCKQAAKRAYDRARYIEKRDEVIARACDWQRENVLRKQAYDAEYRERTRDRRLELKREHGKRYYRENRERMVVYGQEASHRRRARKNDAGVYLFTERDRRRALVRSGHACSYCGGGFTVDNPCHWDHIVPIARQGSHGVGNLTPSCRRCNQSKSHRTVLEWRMGKVVPRPRLSRP